MGIEIKIWANPAGFTEVTGNMPSIIFTKAEKTNYFMPDSLDPIKSAEYFSIFYAQQSYVVSYHFYVSSKLAFRDKRTVISVAIPRGYSFENVQQTNLAVVLGELKSKYEELTNSLSNINALTNAINAKVSGWISEYSSKLMSDEMQPIINLPGAAPNRGYVLYRSSEELQQYLEAPVRLDFNGASLMLLLPVEAGQQYDSFLREFFAPVATEPKYRPKYSVSFPAYQATPIAIISSLDESIDRVFEKEYSNSIHLCGKYSDHFNDWNIQRRRDKTGYVIGLQFSPKIYSYQINVDFCNLQGKVIEKKDVDRWLVPTVGRIVYRDNKWWLVVEGEQNNPLEWRFSSNKPSYVMSQESIKFENNELYIKVDECNFYDVQELQRIIYNKYNFKPIVKIRINGKWQQIEGKLPYKGFAGDFSVMIDESKGYEKLTFLMSTEFSSIHLTEKSKVKFNVVFKGEILRWLEADERREVIVQECKDEEEDNGTVLKVGINLSNNELAYYHFEGGKFICFKAPGFKSVKKIINKSEHEITLKMKPTLRRRLLTSRYVHMLLCLIIGYVLGCFFHPSCFIGNGRIQLIKDTPAETDTVHVNPDTISAKDPDKVVESGKKDNQNPTGGHDNQVARGSSVGQTTSKLSAVIDKAKLDGIEYTWTDLDSAIKKAREKDIYNENRAYFDDRKFALSVLVKEKHKDRNANYIQGELKGHITLSEEQKNTISKIIENVEAYNSDANNYPTIKAMMDKY